MNTPDDLRYTRDHEWVRDEDGRLRMGITHYAQDALGDIVFVQLPEPGTAVQAGMSFAEVESTKSVSDVYAPVTGTVTEVNQQLKEVPTSVNREPYLAGWLCVIEPVADAPTDHLLSPQDYRTLVGEG